MLLRPLVDEEHGTGLHAVRGGQHVAGLGDRFGVVDLRREAAGVLAGGQSAADGGNGETGRLAGPHDGGGWCGVGHFFSLTVSRRAPIGSRGMAL